MITFLVIAFTIIYQLLPTGFVLFVYILSYPIGSSLTKLLTPPTPQLLTLPQLFG